MRPAMLFEANAQNHWELHEP